MTLDQKGLAGANLQDLGLRLDTAGAVLTCAARAGGQTANLAAQDATAPGTRVGLRVREATGSFDYFVVFTH